MINVDWDGLAAELKDEVLEGMKPYLEGAQDDLKTFGAAIAKDLIRAVREKRDDLVKELGHQLEGLAEINRIRLVNASWEQVKNILEIVARVAMKALAAAAVAAI